MVNKINGLLGITAKAGKMLSGTDLVLEEMAKKHVELVIIATDASEKTIKNMNFSKKSSQPIRHLDLVGALCAI